MVELKAKVDDLIVLRKKLNLLGAKYIGTFQQIDQYFKVPEGRFKFREVKGTDNLELIYYEREDIAGPKKDYAFILKTQDAKELKTILKMILTPLVIIEKVREIYHYEGTQIHLDSVMNLGEFVEFERLTSKDSNSTEKDNKVLEKLMRNLDITTDNLEALSYSELALLNNK